MSDRQEYLDAVNAQAFDEGRPCTTCGGSGRVRPGNRIVHCLGGLTGADWDVGTVRDAIDRATEVRWVGGGDHQLAVLLDGNVWRFQVRRGASS